MPNRSAFYMFMEDRRGGVLQSGYHLTGGRAELAQLLDAEWQNLSAEDKERYAERARRFNEQMKQEKGQVTAEAEGQVVRKAPLPPNMSPIEAATAKRQHELNILRRANRPLVREFFTQENWGNLPIVICGFSTYFEPGVADAYVPAEIGLTAFNLKNGVTDNFGRIIDPCKSSEKLKGRGTEVATMVEVLGIPHPGTVDEMSDYGLLIDTLELFLDQYCRWQPKGRETGLLYVFGFDSDFQKLYESLNYIYELAGRELPIKVLSLNLYAHLASTELHRHLRLNDDDPSGDAVQMQPEASEKITTQFLKKTCDRRSRQTMISAHREYGQTLNNYFVYSLEHPLTRYGLFIHEAEVEDVIKDVDNYKYYEELCCMYHLKKSEGIQHCALNMTNRYAFSLLEVLTLSNFIEILPGKHFPEFDNPNKERERRYTMLRRWAITQYEEDLEEPERDDDDDAAHGGITWSSGTARRGGRSYLFEGGRMPLKPGSWRSTVVRYGATAQGRKEERPRMTNRSQYASRDRSSDSVRMRTGTDPAPSPLTMRMRTGVDPDVDSD